MIAVHPDLSTMPPASGKVTRALISVFDKTGVIELGKALSAAGVEILSSGGTAKKLQDAGVDVPKRNPTVDSRIGDKMFLILKPRLRFLSGTRHRF